MNSIAKEIVVMRFAVLINQLCCKSNCCDEVSWILISQLCSKSNCCDHHWSSAVAVAPGTIRVKFYGSNFLVLQQNIPTNHLELNLGNGYNSRKKT